MKRRKLLAHLSSNGCLFVREGAKHSWWANPANHRRTAVPRHTEISNLMAKKICRDLNIPAPSSLG